MTLAAQASRNRRRDGGPTGCAASRSIADGRGDDQRAPPSSGAPAGAADSVTASADANVGSGSAVAAKGSATAATGVQSLPQRAQRTTRPAVTSESGTS